MKNLNLHLCMQLKQDRNPKASLNDTDSTEKVFIIWLVFLADITHTLIGLL